MIEIDAKIFEEFVDKLTLNGTIGTCIIETDKNSMYSRVNTKDNILFSKVVIPKKVFNTFEEGVKISLGEVENFSDVDLLRKALKNYTGKLKMQVEDGMLRLECGDDNAQITLTADEFVTNHAAKEPDFKFDSGFTLETQQLKKVVNNISTLTTKDDTPSVLVEVKDGMCYCVVSRDDNKLLSKVKVEYKDGSFQLNGRYFTQITNAIGEKANISFELNMPIRIVEKVDKLNVTYIVAPIVKDLEEKEEKKK